MNETAEDLAASRSSSAAATTAPARTCAASSPRSARDGRPIVGLVDGIFFRGVFHFGSAPDSVRFRHIAERRIEAERMFTYAMATE